MLNMTVFAAMPTASVTTTNSTKNGALANRRIAYRQSCQTVSIHTRLCFRSPGSQTGLRTPSERGNEASTSDNLGGLFFPLPIPLLHKGARGAHDHPFSCSLLEEIHPKSLTANVFSVPDPLF